MRNLKEDNWFERIMLGLCILIGIPTPYFAIVSIPLVIREGFTLETTSFFLMFLLGLFCIYFSIKFSDISGRYNTRESQLRQLEESLKKEIERKRSAIERDKSNADAYCVQKRREADDYAAKKQSDADAYVTSRRISADEYYNRKRMEIDLHKAKRQTEIDEYREKRQEEINAYKEGVQEEIDEYKEEIEAEINDWKFSDDTLYGIRNYEMEEYKKKFGITDEKQIIRAIKSEFPFTYTASMSADFEAALFEEVEKRLRWKSQPAKSSADEISEAKRKFRKSQIECKTMLYKYEFLLTAFPELRKYVEDEKGLLSLSEAQSYNDFSDNYDRVRDYLSADEYRRLTTTQRNQLALDRYNARPKSNWVIGTEFEMYCEHILRRRGFETIDYGVRKRLNDLGRDIIAKNDNKTYIIQCKRWAESREVHENVICQLYGTAMEYNFRMNRDNPTPTLFDEEVVPMLMTTAELSETAREFAKKLDVVALRVKMGDYPQIKCHIGRNGERIYHLPFDQQYYNTHINENEGDRYVDSVEEAERLGFRRAYRWQGN